MRIAFVTDWMRRGSGLAVAVVNLAEALAAAGHEVVICGPRRTEVAAVLEREPTVATDALPPLGAEPRRRAHGVLALRSRVQRVGADVYVTAGFPFERLAGRLDAPTVLYDHGCVPARGAPPRVAAALLYVQASARAASRRADAVVTVSRWLARGIERARGSADVHVVPNGIDHAQALLAARPSRDAARRRLGLASGAFVALAVGRCGADARYKGVHRLARTLARRRFFATGGLLVAAGPALGADLRRLGRRRVTALGAVEPGVLAAAYAAADVVVSASRWEGFNLPLLEAQYLGTPVLAVDRCAHPEVVRRRVDLVPDTAALADALLRFEPPSAAELAASARFARSFTWARAARAFSQAVEPARP